MDNYILTNDRYIGYKNDIQIQSEYRNNKGQYIIDMNADNISQHTKNINLLINRPSFKNYINTIDTSIIELLDNTESTATIVSSLENKISSLEISKSKLLTSNIDNKLLIDKLNSQITLLKQQLNGEIGITDTSDIINNIPHILNVGDYLYSDMKGEFGNPGYPKIRNKLMSKNRKYVLILNDNLNSIHNNIFTEMVIYSGLFDTNGISIINTNIIAGYNIYSPNDISLLSQKKLKAGNTPLTQYYMTISIKDTQYSNLNIGYINNSIYNIIWSSELFKMQNGQLQLTDTGDLIITNDNMSKIYTFNKYDI